MEKKIWEINSLEEYRELNKDMFKEHIATYKKLENGNDCIIEFMKPNTREEWFRFIYIDGVLNINGDYGYAVFNWYNKNNHILSYLTFKDIGYIMSKCLSCKDEDIKGFSYDLFEEEFESFIQERIEEGYIKDNQEYDIPHVECEEDVISHFKNNYNEYGDDLYETEAFKLGTYLDVRPYIWWHGLQTALEELFKRGVFENE